MEGRLDLDLEERMFPTSTAVGLVGGHARGSPTFRAQPRPKKHAQYSFRCVPEIIQSPDRVTAGADELPGAISGRASGWLALLRAWPPKSVEGPYSNPPIQNIMNRRRWHDRTTNWRS